MRYSFPFFCMQLRDQLNVWENFILWGMLYVVYYIRSAVTKSLRVRVKALLHIKPDSLEGKSIQRIATFLLVAFAWIFFFGHSVEDAFAIIVSMLRENNFGVLFEVGRFNVGGMVSKDWIVIFIGLVVLFITDAMREKKISIYQLVDRQTIFVRWIVYLGMITVELYGKTETIRYYCINLLWGGGRNCTRSSCLWKNSRICA